MKATKLRRCGANSSGVIPMKIRFQMKAQLSAPITRSLLPHYRSQFCVNARAKWLEKYDDLLHFCGHYSCCGCSLESFALAQDSHRACTYELTNQTNESNFLMEVGREGGCWMEEEDAHQNRIAVCEAWHVFWQNRRKRFAE